MPETSFIQQTSAGGVAYRQQKDQVEVALISVGPERRWQLPKGMVNPGESFEAAALREVREEAGVETELVRLIDTIDFWYFGGRGEKRARHHKFVHFFLLRYLSGDPGDHDDEVNEACWVLLEKAQDMLTFSSEKEVLRRASEILQHRV